MAAQKSAEHTVPAAERRAEHYLIRAGLMRDCKTCPACRSRAKVRTTEGFRCRKCGAVQNHREGSLLEGLPLTCREFIGIIRLYAGGIPAGEAAERLGTEHAAVREAYARIRAAVSGSKNHQPTGRGPNGQGLRQSGDSAPHSEATAVFGIRTENGKICIEALPEPKAGLIPVQVPGMLRGNIVFINTPRHQFQAFVMFDWDRNGNGLFIIPSQAGSVWFPVAGFWQYLHRKWPHRTGMAREEIGGFLMDLAFRYNCGDQDIETALTDRLASWTTTSAEKGKADPTGRPDPETD